MLPPGGTPVSIASTSAAPSTPYYLPVRQDWLDRRKEPILAPDLPIVDPHHHLWDRPDWRYLLDELVADTQSGHNILATVFVQARAMTRPTGPVEMRPGGDRFRGIRHISAWDADASIRNPAYSPPRGLLGDKNFREGFAVLGRLGLSFDAWLYHPQIDDVRDLARAFPETKIVLNHVGGPIGIGAYAGKHKQVFPGWAASIKALAACPSVYVKLGGLGMRMGGFGFHEQSEPPSSETLAATWRPYIETCIDAFGPSRCMFESNFPVDKGSYSYPVFSNACKILTQRASEPEKADLFAGTAEKFYRLDVSG